MTVARRFRMSGLFLGLAVVVSIVMLGSFSSEAKAANYFVPVSAKNTGFGSFTEGGSSAWKLRNSFGEPSGINRDEYVCNMYWRRLGLLARVVVYDAYANPCRSGYFSSAWLTGRMWKTGSGIRVGVSSRKARRHSVINCRGSRARKNYRCLGKSGYVLGLHPSECASGRWPTVTASVRNGRVSGLHIFSHSCE